MESLDNLDTLVLRKRRARLLNPISAPPSFLLAVLFNYMPPQPIPPPYNPPQPQPQQHNAQPMEQESYDRRRESLAGEVADIKVDLLRAMNAQDLHEDMHAKRVEATTTRGENARAAAVAKARANKQVEQTPEPQPKFRERHNQKEHSARVVGVTTCQNSGRSYSVEVSRAQPHRPQHNNTQAPTSHPQTRSETKRYGLE
jgi:hypothetical protein